MRHKNAPWKKQESRDGLLNQMKVKVRRGRPLGPYRNVRDMPSFRDMSEKEVRAWINEHGTYL